MIKQALRKLLAATPAVVAKIGTYNFGTVEPAIFTTSAVPEDAENICVIISESSGNYFDVRYGKGGRIYLDVDVWADRNTNATELSNAAWAVWDSIHRKRLTAYLPSGYSDVTLYADPPQQTEDREGFNGYSIRVEFTFLKEL